MTLRLYNTLTRTKEEFKPIDASNVRMYVCGPTVYDFAHIGNARPAIVFDVLFRLLRHLYGADHVTYVRNITDVDDKINARALRDFPGMPLNDAIRQVTEKTCDQYQKDVTALGCLPPTAQPRATEHIKGMVEMIRVLINRGHAYEAAGEVLFDTSSMKDYGALSGRKMEEQLAGARVAVDAHKKNPGDFVLWKQSAADEPGWDSPWGRGRPGWHIECSVMSKAHLGEVFDIHGGGLDLIFPHHENEIAQSRCAHGTSVMANYWMHNGFLQVEGQKMSKSLGNFLTIQDVLSASAGVTARYAMLMTHYTQPIDWTESKLLEARMSLQKFHRWYVPQVTTPETDPQSSRPDHRIVEALSDDLNTPLAFKALHELSDELFEKRAQEKPDLHNVQLSAFARSLDLLGLAPRQVDFSAVKEAEINSLISARVEARKAKDWKKSDEIRDQLVAMGIQIQDVKDPVTGELKTEWEVKR
jgi:cysteinyl-tRNA synthetase